MGAVSALDEGLNGTTAQRRGPCRLTGHGLVPLRHRGGRGSIRDLATSGLTEAEARRRQSEYGPNEVADQGTPTAWRLVLAQFTGVLTLVLLAAGVLSVVLGDLVDAGAILAIVVLNAALGFFQEYRAEQSMAALKRLAAPLVRVRRGGQVLEIPAPAVVPGDVVMVETGNVVAADARLLRSSTLRVQEAALTGESEAVEKDAGVVFADGSRPR